MGLTNDSRKIESGELFAALKTAARDGHDFLESARRSGAAGAIVDRFQEEIELPQLVVDEVGEALLALAGGYRATWQANVVGITGSCGKTTCKEVLACLLSGFATLSTRGNLNNLIGVPMSMLRPEGASCEFAVLEAGISEPGEMERLAAAINPEWGIVTALGPAHLEDLGTVENVAREKGKLFQGSRLRRVFAGESCEPYLSDMAAPRVLLVKQDPYLSVEWAFRFSSEAGRTCLEQRIGGSVQRFEYEGLGAGLASNVALALATAFSMGLEVDQLRSALGSWKPSQMRNEWKEIGGRLVFLDCYNANPISMRDSLATFVSNTPEGEPRMYVIGCMEELGSEASRLHEELGREFPLRNQDFLLVIGSEAASVLRGMKDSGHEMDRCFEIETIEEASERLKDFAGSVFLKGSRRYRLESMLGAFASVSEEKGNEKC
ncbi:Mur ligase middle domain family [Verrucomicrobiia bacterium DG1235]|nr:Mur ligase middle domain family [Verrucomicrobiae bacterium DG1235]